MPNAQAKALVTTLASFVYEMEIQIAMLKSFRFDTSINQSRECNRIENSRTCTMDELEGRHLAHVIQTLRIIRVVRFRLQ